MMWSTRGIIQRILPFLSFKRDSFWSIVIVAIAFFVAFCQIGIIHSLGVFFDLWKDEFGTTDSKVVWVQSLSFAFNIFNPVHAVLIRKFPPQLTLSFISIVILISYILAANFARSLGALIVLLSGCCFLGGGFILMFTMNLVGQVTDKWRPIAYGISNCGAPTGMFVVPLIVQACLKRWSWTTALMILGSLWSVIALFSFFMVPAKNDNDDDDGDEEDDSDLKESRNSPISTPSTPDVIIKNVIKASQEHSSTNNVGDDDTKKDASDSLDTLPDQTSTSGFGELRNLFRRAVFIIFLIYGFFGFGYLLGIQVFLPPLFIESFSTSNGSIASSSNDETSQDKISLCLSLFGVGGIVGVAGMGFVLSCAARRKLVIFTLNSFVLLVVIICYLFIVDSLVGIGILTTLLGALHQAWFATIWTIIYEVFPGEQALTVSCYFFGAAGIASFVIPAGMSAILGSFEGGGEGGGGRGGGEAASILSSPTLHQTTQTPFVEYSAKARSPGNHMVLVFLSVLIGISILLQFCMYLAIRREKNSFNRIDRRSETNDAAAS